MIKTGEFEFDFELARRIHEGNCQKGFYDKSKSVYCSMALILSEMYEAMEAHRKLKFCTVPIDMFLLGVDNKDIPMPSNISYFEKKIKDTVADEYADTMIRFYDTIGDLLKTGVFTESDFEKALGDVSLEIESEEINDLHRFILKLGTKLYMCSKDIKFFAHTFLYAHTYCTLNCPAIEDHIEAKLWYNATRPLRHGNKQY